MLTYSLVCLNTVRGSSYGGHYHCYIRDVDGLGDWRAALDEPVNSPSTTSPKHNPGDFLDAESPVDVIRSALADCGTDTVSIDKLCKVVRPICCYCCLSTTMFHLVVFRCRK